MMYDPDLFGERYRIKSNRLPGYEYSSEGRYVVTICTKNKEHYFGEIENSIMKPNAAGKIVEDEIKNIPTHRKNVRIDGFVVMPNHVHMIIITGAAGNAHGTGARGQGKFFFKNITRTTFVMK